MNPHPFFQLFNYPQTVNIPPYHFNPMLNTLNFPPLLYDQLLPRPQPLPLLPFENSTFKDLRPLQNLHSLNGQSTYDNFDLHSMCSTPGFKNDLMLHRSMSEPMAKPIKVPEKAQNVPLMHVKPLRRDLEKMIRSVMTNINENNQKGIGKERQNYTENGVLLKIYDKLVMKYKQSKRCKEDIIRYILRKVFKTLRSKVMNENKVSNKRASFLMCQRYFELKFNEIKESGVDLEDEEGLLDFFMPYNKNSKNRTMNSSFIDEIFSSEQFCEDYKYFLDHQFERFLQADNNRKIKKLIDFLIVCIEKDNISKLDKFNRLPWLDLWLQDARDNAAALLPEKAVVSAAEKKKMKGKQ